MKLIFFHRRAEYNPCHSTRKPFSTMHVIVWEKPVGGVFVVGAAEIVFIFCQCPCNGKAGSVCSLQAEIGVVPSHPVYQFFYLVCTAHRFCQCQQCAVILFRILADNSCPTGNRQATVILHRFLFFRNTHILSLFVVYIFYFLIAIRFVNQIPYFLFY